MKYAVKLSVLFCRWCTDCIWLDDVFLSECKFQQKGSFQGLGLCFPACCRVVLPSTAWTRKYNRKNVLAKRMFLYSNFFFFLILFFRVTPLLRSETLNQYASKKRGCLIFGTVWPFLPLGRRKKYGAQREKKKIAHPLHSNMRGADVRTCASSSSQRKKKKSVDLNKSQLMLLHSWAPLLFFRSPSHSVWTLTRCPFFLHPSGAFCSSSLCGRSPKEQVTYKSVAALASPALWFPFGSRSCNQSLIQSPPCILSHSLLSL